MEQIEISVSTVVEQAWALAKKHGLILSACLFVFVVIFYVITMGAMPSQEDMMKITSHPEHVEAVRAMYIKIYTHPLYIVAILISSLLSIGLRKMVLDVTKNPEGNVSFDSCKMPAMAYVKVFAIQIIFKICVYAGTLCCIIPGVFLAVRFFLAEVYQLDNPEAGIGESFSASWNMTKDNFGSLLLMGIVAVFIALAGLAACCVGVFFTVIISEFCMMVVYLALKNKIC